MAFLTAQGISRLALELLVRTLVLPRTVARVPGTEFAGSNGDTITVRVRQPRTARTQATPESQITYDAHNEVSVDLTVAHLYDAAKISDEELTLELADFGAQVLAPMVASVAIGAEDQLAAVMNALTPDTVIEWDATISDAETIATVLAAREFLGDNEVPLGNRFLAVSTDIASRLLTLENIRRADQAGTPTALRQAIIGSLFGFQVVESAALDAGTGVAYHESAFVWGNRAPANPRGAADSAVSTSEGVALRTLFSFDPDHLLDRIVVSTFAGAAAVYEDQSGTDNQRFVRIGLGT